MHKIKPEFSLIRHNRSFSFSSRHLLLLLYLFGIGSRFSLALLFRHSPTVQIDESLYINIAKSLAAGEGIAYRSQPVPYPYILYPLLLTPLYLFPLSFDLYRILQFWNAILICSAIFPVYLFAHDFTGSEKKALVAASLTMLMPDMMMAGFLMAESIIWPLSLWLIFFSYRLFRAETSTLRYGALTGLFTALLFWAKPGAIAMGLVLLVSLFFFKDNKWQKTRQRAATVGLVLCVCCIIFIYGLYTLIFGYDFSVLGLYKKQLSNISATWFAAVAECSALQVLLFALACGGIFFVIPYSFRNRYNRENQAFLSAFTIALFVTAIGTAAFVDMHTWTGSFVNPMLHLRYMAMYVPIQLVFSLGATNSENESDKKRLLYGMFGMAALTIFPSAFIGFVPGNSTYMDSVALSAWLGDFGVPVIAGIILSMLSVLFLLIVIVQTQRGRPFAVLMKEGLIFFIFFLLFNNICGYVACNFHKDENHYGQDAVEMNTILETLPQKVLIVTQQNYDETVSYCLEARLRKPMQQVTVDAFMAAMSETEGVYTPFVPADQSPNIGNHSTPDTDTFLFGIGVTNYFELSDSVTQQKTAQGWFTLARTPKNTRLLDSILTGLDLDTLHEKEQAQLQVFNASRYKNGKLTLYLSAHTKEGSAELEILNAGKAESITLSEKNKICLVSLREGNTVLTSHGGDIIISSYRTD